MSLAQHIQKLFFDTRILDLDPDLQVDVASQLSEDVKALLQGRPLIVEARFLHTMLNGKPASMHFRHFLDEAVFTCLISDTGKHKIDLLVHEVDRERIRHDVCTTCRITTDDFVKIGFSSIATAGFHKGHTYRAVKSRNAPKQLDATIS